MAGSIQELYGELWGREDAEFEAELGKRRPAVYVLRRPDELPPVSGVHESIGRPG